MDLSGYPCSELCYSSYQWSWHQPVSYVAVVGVCRMAQLAKNVLFVLVAIPVFAIGIPLACLLSLIAHIIRLVKCEHWDNRADILWALSFGEQTGYEIIKRIDDLRGHHWYTMIGTGELYPILERLLKEGLVENNTHYTEPKRKYTWRLRV